MPPHAPANTSTYIAELPPELLIRIASFLPPTSIARLSESCKPLLELCRSPDVWRPICRAIVQRHGWTPKARTNSSVLIGLGHNQGTSGRAPHLPEWGLEVWEQTENGIGIKGWYQLATRFLLPHLKYLGWHASSRIFRGALVLVTIDPSQGCIVARTVQAINAFDAGQYNDHGEAVNEFLAGVPMPLTANSAPWSALVGLESLRPMLPSLPHGAIFSERQDSYQLPPNHPSSLRSFSMDLLEPVYTFTEVFTVVPWRLGARLNNARMDPEEAADGLISDRPWWPGMRLDLEWTTEKATPLQRSDAEELGLRHGVGRPGNSGGVPDSADAARGEDVDTDMRVPAVVAFPATGQDLTDAGELTQTSLRWIVAPAWRLRAEPHLPSLRTLRSGILKSLRQPLDGSIGHRGPLDLPSRFGEDALGLSHSPGLKGKAKADDNASPLPRIDPHHPNEPAIISNAWTLVPHARRKAMALRPLFATQPPSSLSGSPTSPLTIDRQNGNIKYQSPPATQPFFTTPIQAGSAGELFLRGSEGEAEASMPASSRHEDSLFAGAARQGPLGPAGTESDRERQSEVWHQTRERLPGTSYFPIYGPQFPRPDPTGENLILARPGEPLFAVSLEGSVWVGTYSPHGLEFGTIALVRVPVSVHQADEVDLLDVAGPGGDLSFAIDGDRRDQGPVGRTTVEERWTLEYTKLTGDENVPRGAPSWVATLPEPTTLETIHLDTSTALTREEVEIPHVSRDLLDGWIRGDEVYGDPDWDRGTAEGKCRVAHTGYRSAHWSEADITFVSSKFEGNESVVVDEVRVTWRDLRKVSIFKRVRMP